MAHTAWLQTIATDGRPNIGGCHPHTPRSPRPCLDQFLLLHTVVGTLCKVGRNLCVYQLQRIVGKFCIISFRAKICQQ
ncbi:hypothetical protein HOLleu_32077 [Holothuria leucospilota]|uniref:Uncharacterized protein n=1 Tax=Holothuria leucospilota TaxID=206669 RepID=A0A9Q1BII8_HOLLE|nr:hypothetical protein HOLleu_32077 [Holothuria leucospilota]